MDVIISTILISIQVRIHRDCIGLLSVGVGDQRYFAVYLSYGGIVIFRVTSGLVIQKVFIN